MPSRLTNKQINLPISCIFCGGGGRDVVVVVVDVTVDVTVDIVVVVIVKEVADTFVADAVECVEAATAAVVVSVVVIAVVDADVAVVGSCSFCGSIRNIYIMKDNSFGT